MLVLALSLMVLVGVFLFSDQLRLGATKNFGERILDDVSDRLASSLIDMRLITERTATDTLVVTVSIPKRIGEQNYFIRGENTSFVMRTVGKRSLVSETNITPLWNISVYGTAFSQSGVVQLEYNKTGFVFIS